MDNMDNFRERFEALEQQTAQLIHHTRTVEQRLRWWRGIACGVVMLSLLSLALPSGKAADTQPRGMAERMATMEKKLAAMDFDDAANEVVITGANLRIVNGLGSTETTNGLGNLIVGYNEPRPPEITGPGSVFPPDTRTGSHNIIVGKEHNFSKYGGLVVGELNEISGVFASVLAGTQNGARGDYSAVSGGIANFANAFRSAISGGVRNSTNGESSSITGGVANRTSGLHAVVSGGNTNQASGFDAVVCGGHMNIASGIAAVVCGGQSNEASGEGSAVSGGFQRTAPGQFDWAAGPLFADF